MFFCVFLFKVFRVCFKNYLYTKLISPKCPTCCVCLLGDKNETKINLSNPSISENNTEPTNVFNLTDMFKDDEGLQLYLDFKTCANLKQSLPDYVTAININ